LRDGSSPWKPKIGKQEKEEEEEEEEGTTNKGRQTNKQTLKKASKISTNFSLKVFCASALRRRVMITKSSTGGEREGWVLAVFFSSCMKRGGGQATHNTKDFPTDFDRLKKETPGKNEKTP